MSVSYTHLDVYKRQLLHRAGREEPHGPGGRRFESLVSVLLSGSLLEQDARPPDSFNLINGDTRTAYEAIVREAQIGIFLPRFDLRIGQQRIPWGRGDAFTPNDVVNSFDLRDQFLIETEVRRLPTFALRGDLSLGPVVITGAVSYTHLIRRS